jgi:putative membrane protein
MKKSVVLAMALMLPAFTVSVQAADTQGALTDAEIAHIVVTANTADIENGNLAKTKASNEDVRGFAQRMIADHTDSNQQASELAKKLNVTPKDNAISQSLKDDAKASLEKLKGLSGKEFDKAYIDGEIALHKKVIDVADNKLVPNVKNEELKALLIQTRPTLVSHREHAEKIKPTLK